MKCRMPATADTANTLWEIGTNLDDVHAQLGQIIDTLRIFEEKVDGDLDFLKGCNDRAKWFVERYNMTRSLMSVAQLYMINTLQEMRTQIDAIYEISRKARPRATE